jgi:hypothetical protein
MWWILLGIFFGVPLIIGAIAAIQRRRHPPLETTRASSDFPNDDNPWYDRPDGLFTRLRKP